MEKKFYSDWAVYKGTKFRCQYYSDNVVKLYNGYDELMKEPVYTVLQDELEDSFMLTAKAILNGVSYTVYEIENDTVVYKKCLGKDEFTKGIVTDFDMVYFQKNHRDRLEREVVYFNEKKIDRSMAYQIFWIDENKSGNFSFGELESVISVDELLEELQKIYSGRMEEDEYNGPGWDIDYLGHIRVDGAQLEIRSDFGIMTISALEKQGNRYIEEIAEHFRKNTAIIAERKKLKPVVITVGQSDCR